jgi:hypothetical protein
MGGIPAVQRPTHSRTHNNIPGPQTAIFLFQVQQFVDLHDPLYREAKQHHKDIIYKECLNVNIDPMARGAGMTSAADNAEGRGNAPGFQQMTCSRMHKQPNGHQTAVSPSQSQSSVGLSAPICKEPRGCPGDARYGGYLNRDDKSKRRLMKSSVSKNKRSTVLYSPKMTPKAPDKGAWHIDDKLRTEAHYAPQPRERDCVENTTWWREKELTTKRQQSQCDIHHETINMT